MSLPKTQECLSRPRRAATKTPAAEKKGERRCRVSKQWGTPKEKRSEAESVGSAQTFRKGQA